MTEYSRSRIFFFFLNHNIINYKQSLHPFWTMERRRDDHSIYYIRTTNSYSYSRYQIWYTLQLFIFLRKEWTCIDHSKYLIRKNSDPLFGIVRNCIGFLEKFLQLKMRIQSGDYVGSTDLEIFFVKFFIWRWNSANFMKYVPLLHGQIFFFFLAGVPTTTSTEYFLSLFIGFNVVLSSHSWFCKFLANLTSPDWTKYAKKNWPFGILLLKLRVETVDEQKIDFILPMTLEASS